MLSTHLVNHSFVPRVGTCHAEKFWSREGAPALESILPLNSSGGPWAKAASRQGWGGEGWVGVTQRLLTRLPPTQPDFCIGDPGPADPGVPQTWAVAK